MSRLKGGKVSWLYVRQKWRHDSQKNSALCRGAIFLVISLKNNEILWVIFFCHVKVITMAK